MLLNKPLISYRCYPWLVIALSSLFMLYKYTLQVSPSIMSEELMQTFHVSGAGLGHLTASFFYSFLVTQLFVGYLLDRYSPRLLTICALMTCAIGTYGFACADSLLSASVARIFIGIGAAFATVSYMKMASIWFQANQFAFVSGLSAMAVMLGGIFGQAPLSLLVKQWGWRDSLALCGLLGLLLAGFFLLLRDKPLSNTASVTTHDKEFSLRDITQVLRNKQNWLLTLYSGLAFAPIDAFAGLWSIPFLRTAYQLDYPQAAFLVSFIFLGLGLGCPILGFVSDNLGTRRPIMQLSSMISLGCISIIIYCPTLPLGWLGLLLFIFGFTTSAFMLGFAVGREINPVKVAATIIALINTGDVVFSAITQPLIGKLLDWGQNSYTGTYHFSISNYQSALTILPCYLILAWLLLYFIQEPNRRSTHRLGQNTNELRENNSGDSL